MINFQDFRHFRFWSRERGRGGVAWTPFVMHWSFYSTVLPGDMQI